MKYKLLISEEMRSYLNTSSLSTERAMEAADVAQSFLAGVRLWVWSSGAHKSAIVVHVYNIITPEMETGRLEVQDHLWLYSEFEASLDYTHTHTISRKPFAMELSNSVTQTSLADGEGHSLEKECSSTFESKLLA